MNNDELALAASERDLFEAMCKKKFECRESSFERAYPSGYYKSISSNTHGGRVQPNYSDVSMLEVVWQAGRAPPLARIAELEAQVASARDDALEEAAAIASVCAQEYSRDRDHGEAYAANFIARNIRALKSSAREAT